MSSVDPTIKLEKMDKVQSDNVDIVLKSVDTNRIIVQDSNADEDVKTTEYFLNMDDNVITEENHETHFVTVEDENLDNGDAQFVSVEVEDDQIILQDKDVILWNEICRICANGSDRFIPIFSGEGLEHDFQNKIHTYLPFQVNEDDNLPHQVCYNCAATLLAWHDLFKGCIDAQQRLVELQSKLKDQYYNDSNIEESNETVLEVHNIKSKESLAQVKNVSSAEIQHVGEISSETERSRSLQTPLKVSFDTLIENKESVKVSNALSSVKIDAKNARWMTVADFAKSPLEPMDTVDQNQESRVMKADITKSPTGPTNSLDCNQESLDVITSDDDVIDITDDRHDDNDDKDDNDAEYALKKKIKQRRKALEKVVYICPDCSRPFKLKDSFNRHMRIHRNERPFTCHMCGKQFRDPGGLSRHIRDVHVKLKKFSCDQCGKSFCAKATRDDHVRTHTGERPFICESCGNRFTSKASLYTHSLTHSNNFPFSCLQCGRKFRRRQELMCHVMTHTGEKKFDCDVCGKRFRLKAEVRRHMTIHSEEKPFCCKICDFKCKQNRYLNTHMRKQHREHAPAKKR